MSHSSGALVEDRHRLQHAEVDEPGLLDPEMTSTSTPALLPRPRHELVVGSRPPRPRWWPPRTGRRAVDVGDLLHPSQGGRRPAGWPPGQPLHVAAAGPEPDHLLLAGHDLEAILARHPGHDEVEAVGADVDGRQRLDGLAACRRGYFVRLGGSEAAARQAR